MRKTKKNCECSATTQIDHDTPVPSLLPTEVLSTWLHHLAAPPGWFLSTFDHSCCCKQQISLQLLSILIVVTCGFFIWNYDHFSMMINQKSPLFSSVTLAGCQKLCLFLSLLIPLTLVPHLLKFHGVFGLEAPTPLSWCTQGCSIELIQHLGEHHCYDSLAPLFSTLLLCPDLLFSILVSWFSLKARHRNFLISPKTP